MRACVNVCVPRVASLTLSVLLCHLFVICCRRSYFLYFLLATSLLTTLVSIVCAMKFIAIISNVPVYYPHAPVGSTPLLLFLDRDWPTMLLLVYSLSAFAFVASMGSYHLRLLAQGITTNEQVRGVFGTDTDLDSGPPLSAQPSSAFPQAGWAVNCQRVFGDPLPPRCVCDLARRGAALL